MALGFGFNKAKVLSSAEKFVQQGKLQNAIAEYEKIIKEDPKDLTVLNTIGDLYSRVGQNDKACEYFKKVGDQYAQDGFTVKAIAIYKKLTRLSPPTNDSLIKLAELYTQQGLFNDAKAQYLVIADQLLKSADNAQAARIFQKILELDPENTVTQSKLADLYIKLGNKDEARNIYYSAAESLYARNSYDAADEALGRVLSIDPNNVNALLLRGMIATASGDSHSAIQFLDKVPDLESRPDALRALLRARLQLGKADGIEALASKLFTVHHDMNGITAVAEWNLANNRVEEALRLYDSYADRFMAANPVAFQTSLYPLIGRIRTNPSALAAMLRLLKKAGNTTHLNEVMELLAHASAQDGNFEQARDLYKELSEAEPENPLHLQNYKQMLARLGEDAAIRPLSAEEGSQAFMVEELEHAAPVIHQQYSEHVERSLEAALTDAELFVSYNVPQKAIAPLEAALPFAPRDVNLNQRLATLYAKAERYEDASNACKVLSEVFGAAGHQMEAQRYGEASERYRVLAAARPSPKVHTPPAVPVRAVPVPPPVVKAEPDFQPPPEAPPQSAESQPLEATVKEFVLDVPAAFEPDEATSPEPAAIAEQTLIDPSAVAAFTPEVVEAKPAEPDNATAHEIDLSNEWEGLLSVEEETPAAAPAAEIPVPAAEQPVAAEPKVVEPVAPEPVAAEPVAAEPVIQEIISEPIVAEPVAAKPAEPVAAEPVVSEPVPAAPNLSRPAADPAVVADKVQEIQFYISQGFWDIAHSALEDLKDLAPQARELQQLKDALAAAQKRAAAQTKTPIHPPKPAKAPEKQAPEPALRRQEEPAVEEFILDVPDHFATEPKPAAAPHIVSQPVPTKAAAAAKAPQDDVLGDLVLDLEESLGSDFFPSTPSKPEVKPPVPIEAPLSAAAASASATSPVPASSLSAAGSISTINAAASVPAAHSAVASSSVNGGIMQSEASSVLSDIFSELQEEMEEAEPEAEDPETHYSLGIAFKEMGLLDEAIGELQKVCHAMEHGVSFSQPIQAYTWLAQCLVDKGVPEAAVRWYEKALNLPGLDQNSRCSIYYDLGSAYESFGDSKAALANFMEVYSSNIDFRDVASRIKVLKS